MPTLDWLNRDAAFRIAAAVPTRVLRPHAAGHAFGEAGGNGNNLLIQGDNLQALKALLPFYRGRVKGIFIDPPYNTKSAFEHYDDNLEHSQWLSMMLPRLQLLRELLAEDGSIWVTIDDNEGHYLKVLMDEVFGRRNTVATITWQKTSSVHNNADHFSSASDLLLVSAKDIAGFRLGRIPRSERNATDYTNPDHDPRGPWSSSPLHVSLTSGQRGAQFARSGTSSGLFALYSPNGAEVLPPPGRAWGYSRETIEALQQDNRIWWGRHGRNQPRLKRFLSEQREGVVPTTIWTSDEVGHNQEAKAEVLKLRATPTTELFATPKPERLLHRIFHIATNPGDLVLDSFLGSGTTAAVAHKMGRRWIGIEMGEHALTHCLPRLRKVVEGEQGGISRAVAWQGGGGFRLLQLGAPLFDADGEIHADVRFADLAAFIWMRETGTALAELAPATPKLGVHDGTAYYLLFNGILGDRRPEGGNVLTSAVLAALRASCWHDGPKLIYGEACRLGAARLAAEGIVFKQLPHALPR
ncbi:MAG: site-specific DNA-methyltransferase [Rubrivivax sp.]